MITFVIYVLCSVALGYFIKGSLDISLNDREYHLGKWTIAFTWPAWAIPVIAMTILGLISGKKV